MSEAGMGQRTRWLEAEQIIDCQYGRITVIVWLTREVERIKKSEGRSAEIRQSEPPGSTKVALFAS
jgi:hypothetical protein